METTTPPPAADPVSTRRERYVAVVVLVAVALVALAAFTVPLSLVNWEAFGVLVVLGMLSERLRETDVTPGVALSLTSIMLLSCVVFTGPVGAAAVGAVAPIGVSRGARLVFNSALYACVGAVGGLAYSLAGGLVGHMLHRAGTSGQLALHVAAPLLLADLAQALVNAVLLAGIIYLSNGTPVRQFVRGVLKSAGLMYVGYGVIAFIFVVEWYPARLGAFSTVLVLAPLLVARWSMVQYGDEFRAHERTLDALVAAMETKDVYTRGHSERVARLCEAMAHSLGLNQEDTQALRFAGMLHDIGKLSLPSGLLRASTVTDEQFAQISRHADQGVEMVRQIDFLADSVGGIRHHHERWDGLGYPSGLSGTDIPLFARIIAVVDAFDSLTTVRADRDAYSVEAALGELRDRAGSQLDPAMVEALERALPRTGWEPTQLPPRVLATAGASYDHDCPENSDRLAASPQLVDLVQRGRHGAGRRSVSS